MFAGLFSLQIYANFSGSDTFEGLNSGDYHDTHTNPKVWVHIMGPLLRSWPFCDIWKGQEEHYSRAHTHTHTLL